MTVTLILTFYLQDKTYLHFTYKTFYYQAKNKSIALLWVVKKIEETEIKAKHDPGRETTNFLLKSFLKSPSYE